MRSRSLNGASAFTFFTRSWQSSKVPFTAEDAPGVGARDELVERRDVVHELAQDRLRKLRVGKAPPAGKIRCREALGHIQAAVGCQAFEQDVGETLGLAAAAGADVEHGATSSSLLAS